MGSKNRRAKRGSFWSNNFWQSADYNFRSYHKNLDMLLSLAINRFRWVNIKSVTAYAEQVRADIQERIA